MIQIRNKFIPFGRNTAMTVWPFLFLRLTCQPTKRLINHENIHGVQQQELGAVGILLAVIMLVYGCGWWSVAALPLFYWLYLICWVYGLIRYRNSEAAYYAIPFEREAYANESSQNYLSTRLPFAWVGYIRQQRGGKNGTFTSINSK